MPSSLIGKRNLLTPDAKQYLSWSDGTIRMGCTFVLDHQSVWVGKGHVDGNPPHELELSCWIC